MKGKNFSKSSSSKPGLAVGDARSIVEDAIAGGYLRRPGQAARIDKDGEDVSRAGSIRSQWMHVDPAKAARWLENNFCNRRLKEDVVKAYARDMANGVWAATHQGIAFNDKDELIDGQHRLRAIVLSRMTVRMMVTFGLPSSIEDQEMTTMDAVDRGCPRSVADQLKIQHGFKNGGIIASICALLGSLCYGKKTRRLSVGQTLEIFHAFEDEIAWVVANRAKGHGLKAAGVNAAFVFALAASKKAEAGDLHSRIRDMFVSLISGERLAKGFPVWRLREFLTSEDAKLLTRTANRGLTELVLQAIHLELKEEPIQQLELAFDGVERFRSMQRERVSKIADIFTIG